MRFMGVYQLPGTQIPYSWRIKAVRMVGENRNEDEHVTRVKLKRFAQAYMQHT